MTTAFPIIDVWVTKYALTDGVIHQKRARRCETSPETMIEIVGKPYEYYHKGQWFLTRVEAVERVEVMRSRKIAALMKQLARIKGLRFT